MFGENLKKARKHKGFTQKELSKILGISDNGISNWENGISRPDIDQIVKICQALDVSPNELITVDVVEEIITPAEKELLRKYNLLDKYGRKVVECIIELEYERCTRTETIKIAARNGTFEERTGTDSEKQKMLDEFNQMQDVEDD